MISACIIKNRRTADDRPGYAVCGLLSTELMAPEGYDVLDGLRRECIRERDYWVAQKRAVGKFAKEQERLWLRRYRAVCTIFGWAYAPDLGDCPHREIYYWDQDQVEELDWAATAACVRIWSANPEALRSTEAASRGLMLEQTQEPARTIQGGAHV